MSKKCFVIKSCLYLVVISLMLPYFCFVLNSAWSNNYYYDNLPILKVWRKKEMHLLKRIEFNSPSVESFIRASATDNSLKGLAVYLNLTNACQTLDDVSKAKNQVHKIALVTLMHNDQTTCTLQDLAKKCTKCRVLSVNIFLCYFAL